MADYTKQYQKVLQSLFLISGYGAAIVCILEGECGCVGGRGRGLGVGVSVWL